MNTNIKPVYNFATMFGRAAAFLVLAGWCFGEEHYLFRTPTVNATEIVFSYAGDLWSVPRTGGDARRLTSHPGSETDPVFSPDGKTIAFSGEYDGSQAVYVMPASGGVPKCLTWNHAQENWPAGWTRDGKRVLFGAARNTAYDNLKLYTVDLEGGFPEEVPLPVAVEGSYSPDGSHLAYVPVFQWEPAWKGYRGGQMNKIWIANLADSSVVPLPHDHSNDFNPMWVGDRIYFLSDRNGPVTLFSYDLRTRQIKQLIENHGFDFKSADAGPGAIVYEQFGGIGIYDLDSGKAKPVSIRVAGDFPEVRPHRVDVSSRLHNPDVSPNGARAVFEARGEIITIPSEKGDPRNLTNTPGANEREPAWSPKGENIAFFSDESGEYQLYVRNQNGMEEPRKYKLADRPGFYFKPRWSPDATKIAYLDSHCNVWYLDIARGTPVLVDQDSNAQALAPEVMATWSPDNKWLAYTKTLPNHWHAIWIYSVAEGKSRQVTDGMSDAKFPVFDKGGKYLYFTSNARGGPAGEVDLQSFFFGSNSSVYLMILAKDRPSPFLPRSDEENAAKETSSDDAMKIDFDDIAKRTLPLPNMTARSYAGLYAGPAGIVYAAAGDLFRYEVGARQEKTLASGISDVAVSVKGEKLLYKKDNAWWLMTVNDSGGFEAHNLQQNGIEVVADPPAEWRQIYHEAWRVMREYFYDPAHHGLDFQATEKHYAPFLDHLSSRQDLNYLLEEGFGNLKVSHLFIAGGDQPDVKHISTGLLGADYSIEQGRYRFKHVYRGEPWDADMRPPLTHPGVNVEAGDFLLAVNGQEITSSQNLYKVFEGLAGKEVWLKVGPDASGAKGSRTVLLWPLGDETSLRYQSWVEDNRQTVDRISHGRVGYIHMPDTGPEGGNSFTRYFYAQVGKEGLIIDDRFNHGGHFATDVIGYLLRNAVGAMAFRNGPDYFFPLGIYGPKAMIINEMAGSGGDFMPAYFRRFGVGKLVGVTTWGGSTGNSSDVPALMDGGNMKVPGLMVWSTGKQPVIENHGTPPDVEVTLDPKTVREGHDPQLEKAVEMVMEELARHPPAEMTRPKYSEYR
jgi:tricorn protease